MMGDGKALQAGTSHNLGQNSRRRSRSAISIRLARCNIVDDIVGTLDTLYRAIIMVHGDDQGLILPPRLAPHQVVIVPIFKTDEEKALVFEAAKKIRGELVKAEIRVKVDEREGQAPVSSLTTGKCAASPLRMEIGPKDVAKAASCWRAAIGQARKGKASFPGRYCRSVQQLLIEIQKALFDRALAFRGTHTFTPKNFDDFGRRWRQASRNPTGAVTANAKSRSRKPLKRPPLHSIEQPSGPVVHILQPTFEGDCYLW